MVELIVRFFHVNLLLLDKISGKPAHKCVVTHTYKLLQPWHKNVEDLGNGNCVFSQNALFVWLHRLLFKGLHALIAWKSIYNFQFNSTFNLLHNINVYLKT